MVTKTPKLLLAHPEKTVLPKLEFFHSIGMSAPVLAQVILRYPVILGCSLEKRIIPFYEYLKNLLQKDERVVHVFNRLADSHFVQIEIQRLHPNMAILRKYGVSDSRILLLLELHPRALMLRSDRLVELVDRVTELGIDVSSLMSIHAIPVLYETSRSAWERRTKLYCRWGWSESDIRMAFSRHPICMKLSEKKIMSTMEFLVNEMNCQPKTIVRNPSVLLYSLEKRTVPRCRVVKLLMLIKKSCTLLSLVSITDQKFLERFVTKYENVPQLLGVYHGKVSLPPRLWYQLKPTSQCQTSMETTIVCFNFMSVTFYCNDSLEFGCVILNHISSFFISRYSSPCVSDFVSHVS